MLERCSIRLPPATSDGELAPRGAARFRGGAGAARRRGTADQPRARPGPDARRGDRRGHLPRAGGRAGQVRCRCGRRRSRPGRGGLLRPGRPAGHDPAGRRPGRWGRRVILRNLPPDLRTVLEVVGWDSTPGVVIDPPRSAAPANPAAANACPPACPLDSRPSTARSAAPWVASSPNSPAWPSWPGAGAMVCRVLIPLDDPRVDEDARATAGVLPRYPRPPGRPGR